MSLTFMLKHSHVYLPQHKINIIMRANSVRKKNWNQKTRTPDNAQWRLDRASYLLSLKNVLNVGTAWTETRLKADISSPRVIAIRKYELNIKVGSWLRTIYAFEINFIAYSCIKHLTLQASQYYLYMQCCYFRLLGYTIIRTN